MKRGEASLKITKKPFIGIGNQPSREIMVHNFFWAFATKRDEVLQKTISKPCIGTIKRLIMALKMPSRP